jgi:tRNA(Ile2) C34 agmatinyltransferase TiaS
VGDFLTIPRQVGGSRFISYEQRGQGGKMTIILDRENGPKVLSLISEDVVDYLSSLFAPVASGEVLTRVEYLELVTSVYKKAVADEISAARIRASINFPRTITRIQGGIASGARAEFNIPLLDILVLDRPLRYEVEW